MEAQIERVVTEEEQRQEEEERGAGGWDKKEEDEEEEYPDDLRVVAAHLSTLTSVGGARPEVELSDPTVSAGGV